MSIVDTRTGFYHQDYVAVWVFLQRYLEGNITRFYTDYVYNQTEQLSHDIYYFLKEDGREREYCIEVKTGDTFINKNDKIGKALKEIYLYLQDNPSKRYSIYISKDFRRKISDCWNALSQLQATACRNTPENTTHLNLLKRLPQMRDLDPRPTPTKMKDFVARLELEQPCETACYAKLHNRGLESDIKDLIQDIGEILLGVDPEHSNNHQLQSYALTHEMIYITVMHSGTNDDVLPLYRDAIAKHFSLREQSAEAEPEEIRAKYNEFKRKLRQRDETAIAPEPESDSNTTEEIGVPNA